MHASSSIVALALATIAAGTVGAVPLTPFSSADAGDQGKWFDERRDLRSDFARAFGQEASGRLPPTLAIAFATNADDTGSSALAYFGDITLTAE